LVVPLEARREAAYRAALAKRKAADPGDQEDDE